MNGYKRYIGWKAIPPNLRIMQIYSKGLEYSLLSSDYKQCHSFVWCKDFLHDVVFSTIHNKKFEVYRFKFDPEIDPVPCLDRIRLMVTNAKDKKFAEKIPGVIDFINQVEDRLKMKKSFVRQCWAPPEAYQKAGIFMFEGSKRWIQAPPMLSLYSLLLRVGFCHKEGEPFSKTIEGIQNGDIKPYQTKDNRWLKSVEPALQKILRIGDRRIFHRDIQLNYPRTMEIDSIHNRMGIIGLATDMIHKSVGEPVLVPYWHYHK